MARREPPPHFPLAESAWKAVTCGNGSPALGPPSWRKVWGESGWGRGGRRGSGVGRRGGERARELGGRGEWGGGCGGGRGGGRGSGGAAAQGSSSPVSLPPSAQLRELRAGRGDVEQGRAGSRPEWVRGAPQLRAHAARWNFVAAPQVWGPAELCMWGARASRKAAAALSSSR